MAFRISEDAEADLDRIWLYVARESGSADIATRAVENISDRFWLLGENPRLGRRRDHDLRPGLRTFPADDHVIVYRLAENDLVIILFLVHGSRDIEEQIRLRS